MVIAAVDGIVSHESEGVVHPPHVPFHVETETADVGRAGDTRPRRRLLRDGDDPAVLLVDRGVGFLQEGDGLEVLPAAVDVRRPTALRPRIVEVQHRRDRVDAQTVHVELVEPVQRVGDEEVADLAPPEIEHVRSPVELLAALGIAVLVERCAVETCQCPLVLGEVGRYPVDDDPMPAACRWSTNHRKSSGEPNREVGA